MMDSIKILIEELFSEITYLREDFFSEKCNNKSICRTLIASTLYDVCINEMSLVVKCITIFTSIIYLHKV